MKKPEKKIPSGDIRTDIDNEICGYIRAYDKWEKYHNWAISKYKKKIERLKIMLEPIGNIERDKKLKRIEEK